MYNNSNNKIFIIIILIVLLIINNINSQSTTKEEFIEIIDKYIYNDDDSVELLNENDKLNYNENQQLIIQEVYRSALKRIKNRLLEQDQVKFDPPTYNETVINSFSNKILLNPQSNLTINPYDIVDFNTTLNNQSVCAVLYPKDNDRSSYYLVNYTSAMEAENAGAFVTHLHPCGYCSTTKDLASYMAHMDLTSPIRDCAIVSFVSDQVSLDCIQHSAGFTYNCAVIWLYDALNTRKECLDICLYDWIMHVPNNVPVNSTNLSPCIECDEVKSGPIFKVVSGRTRRDSGLKSAINRPPDSIYNVTHYYY